MKFKNIKNIHHPLHLLLSVSLICLLLQGCYIDKEEILYPGSTVVTDCSIIAAKFSADVQPIVSTKCAIPGCHDATASGGVTFQTYTQISDKKDRIYTRAITERSMPATGFLTTEEINKIKCWINSGALNN